MDHQKGTPGCSGVGGIARNHDKEFVGIFSLDIGHAWAYEAEVRAILMALNFCKQFSLQPVIIESDSLLAVGWVSCKSNRPIKMLPDLKRIDILCNEIDCLGVCHVYREANDLADHLATEGCGRSQPIWSLL